MTRMAEGKHRGARRRGGAWLRVAVAFALTISALSATTSASAARSARLVYVRGTGAETCPDEDALRTAVAARLGYDPFVFQAPTTIFGDVRREGAGFRVDVRHIGEDGRERGSRKLSVGGSSCTAAIEAMALTMSIVIEPLSLAEPANEAGPSSTDVPRDETPRAPAIPAAPLSEEPDDRARTPPLGEARPPAPVRVDAGLALLGSLGTAPSPVPGVAAFVGVRMRDLSVDVEGRAELAGSAPAESQGGRIVSSLITATLVPCGHLGPLYGCALGSLGTRRATSAETSSPRVESSAYTAVGFRVGGAIPLASWLEGRAYVSGLVSLSPQVSTLNGVPVYTSSRFAADVNLAVAMRIW